MAVRTREGHDIEAVAVARRDWAYPAFQLLHLGYFVLPLLVGLDKFFDRAVDWEQYLWHGVTDFINVTPHQFMVSVGVVEIAAAFLVLIWPRIGSLVVAGWLGGVVANLMLIAWSDDKYWDIALRDLGLMVGAIALFLLATNYRPVRTRR